MLTTLTTWLRPARPARRIRRFSAVEQLETRDVPNNTAAVLSSGDLFQDWSNTALITANNDWSNVPAIIGFNGAGLTGANPATILAPGTTTPPGNVVANATNTTTQNVGVAEFDSLQVVGIQGTNTPAGSPFLLIHLNTTGVGDVTISYVLKDLDGKANDAAQAVALQYRIGNTGNFINVPAGLVTDATLANSATLTTSRSVVLPAAVNNQSLVQVRIITASPGAVNEFVGVDDIRVHSAAPRWSP